MSNKRLYVVPAKSHFHVRNPHLGHDALIWMLRMFEMLTLWLGWGQIETGDRHTSLTYNNLS